MVHFLKVLQEIGFKGSFPTASTGNRFKDSSPKGLTGSRVLKSIF